MISRFSPGSGTRFFKFSTRKPGPGRPALCRGLTLTLTLETYLNKIWLSNLIPTAYRLTNLTLTQAQVPGPPYGPLTYLTLTLAFYL